MSDELTRPANEEPTDEVEAHHGRKVLNANDEPTDEATEDNEVEAHSGHRKFFN